MLASIEEAPLFENNNYTNPKSPLDLEIIIIGVNFACELNEKWHSRLPHINASNVLRNTHYICFAAKYKGRFYAVAIWSSPVAQNRFRNGENILELRRLAICEDAPKYTASRMLSIMTKVIKNKFPAINKLISYQDTEVHAGTIYKASNWIIGNKSNGISWTTKTRKRNKEQTIAPKIRWEKII